MRVRGRSRRGQGRPARGLTLLELLLTLAIIGIITSIAVPSYLGYREKLKYQQAIADIKIIEVAIQPWISEKELPPDSLAQVGKDGYQDPWGNPYRYMRIAGKKGFTGFRKDRNLHPLNTDYDLYSMGPDGDTALPLTAKKSLDDVIRANDGRFVGAAQAY